MKILISGSTGLIGTHLVPKLQAEGHTLTKLVRGDNQVNVIEIPWDLKRGLINPALLEGFDIVIHLAGESIAQRWTKERKQNIRESRVLGTDLLCRALVGLQKPPKLFICASAVGYYGDRGEEVLTEKSAKGVGFLSDVCAEWEAATQMAKNKGIRVVNLRFGAILAKNGGMLEKMLMPFKLGLGGQIGSGQQYVSWITIDDAIKVINEVLVDDSYQGPINVVSPNPVTNKEFTSILGKVLNRPTFMSVPAFMARLAFGEMADEVVLSSTRVMPAVLSDNGFKFSHSHLEGALRHLLDKKM